MRMNDGRLEGEAHDNATTKQQVSEGRERDGYEDSETVSKQEATG